jgi:hypothetical protein
MQNSLSEIAELLRDLPSRWKRNPSLDLSKSGGQLVAEAIELGAFPELRGDLMDYRLAYPDRWQGCIWDEAVTHVTESKDGKDGKKVKILGGTETWEPACAILADKLLAGAKPVKKQSERHNKSMELLFGLGIDSRKISDIIKSDKSVDDKMRAICGEDKQFINFNSRKWAELLNVSEGAIRKTMFWKRDREQVIAEMAERERM